MNTHPEQRYHFLCRVQKVHTSDDNFTTNPMVRDIIFISHYLRATVSDSKHRLQRPHCIQRFSYKRKREFHLGKCKGTWHIANKPNCHIQQSTSSTDNISTAASCSSIAKCLNRVTTLAISPFAKQRECSDLRLLEKRLFVEVVSRAINRLQ